MLKLIEKLEDVDKKMVFVLEDLHFIDPETYSFLKHFIKIANNNKFIRKSICIILTLRMEIIMNIGELAMIN